MRVHLPNGLDEGPKGMVGNAGGGSQTGQWEMAEIYRSPILGRGTRQRRVSCELESKPWLKPASSRITSR